MLMVFPYSYVVRSPKMMLHLGKEMGSVAFPGLVIYLDGELGTGKTTLARGIAAAFDWHEVRSPSFTLINEYPTDPPIAHIDLYRLKESELAEMGIEEYIDSGYLVIIEWGKPDYFSFTTEWWHVMILYDDDSVKSEHRMVKMRASGVNAIEALRRLNRKVSPWGA